jgi:hypothetical protein
MGQQCRLLDLTLKKHNQTCDNNLKQYNPIYHKLYNPIYHKLDRWALGNVLCSELDPWEGKNQEEGMGNKPCPLSRGGPGRFGADGKNREEPGMRPDG